MTTTLRAALAVIMLVGFYVFAAAIIGGLVWLGIALDSPRLILFMLVVAGAMVLAFWRVLRTKPEPPDGVRVERAHAPHLWAAVEDIAAQVGTRAPDEIQLIPDVNAAVVEDAKWLGLVGGRRYLIIGTPLLQAFTVAQLRSVLAHELGHYSHNHTRLGALTYRGRMMIVHTVQRMDDVMAFLLIGYAKLFLLVESAVSRRQEFEADLASARVAGRDAATSALRELPVLSQAWQFYLGNYVAWGLDSGYAPAGIIRSFPDLMAARADMLAELRRQPVDNEQSRWDSHPPIAQRIAVLEKQPATLVAVDNRPAMELIPGADGLLDALEGKFHLEERQRVSFAEYTSHAQQANAQFVADRLYRAAGRVSGAPAPGLNTVIQIVQNGRRAELEHAVGEGDALVEHVEAALASAAVRSGAASWRMSWSAPVELVDRAGQPMPLEDLAKRISAGDPASDALGELGIEVAQAQVVGSKETADRAEVVGAMLNMKVDGKRRDVLVLDSGLIVVPASRRWKMARRHRRLAELAVLGPKALLAMPENRYLPYEEMRVVTAKRRLRKTYEITMHDGTRVRIRRGGETEDMLRNKAFDAAMASVMR